jgi:1-acyl-sn-glycerol-3-phosphate acyltransferase
MALFWLIVNALQAVFATVWTAGWILVALAVCAVMRRRGPGLALARRVWAPGLLRAGWVRLDVTGLERLDRSRPCLFAANHQSWLDIAVLFAALPVPVLFLAKRELGRVPFLGWYMEAMGMVLVERGDRQDAVRSVEAVAARLQEGWSVLSFPEGSRTRDGRVQHFKSGSLTAAIEAGVPVVPVALDGVAHVLPRGRFRPRPGCIRVLLGEPISTEGLTRADRAVLARRAQQQVEMLLERPREALSQIPSGSRTTARAGGA